MKVPHSGGACRFAFLLCSERSGSNFITALLGGHSGISGPPPTHLFRLFVNNLDNYGDLARDENWKTLVEDFDEGFRTKLGVWATERPAREIAARVSERTLAALLRELYEEEARSEGAEVVLVKENHAYRLAAFALAHFPECRFLHLVRDPRDVAASWLRTGTIPGGVAKAVETWLEDQTETRRLLAQLSGTGRTLVVRYEDLIEETHRELRRLFSFLDLPFEAVDSSFFHHPRSRANSRRIEAWRNLSQPVMKGNAGKHLGVLSPDEIHYVELSCGDLMTQNGYSFDSEIGDLDPDRRSRRIQELRERLSPGSHLIPSSEERGIRERRLETIRRVMNRRLPF